MVSDSPFLCLRGAVIEDFNERNGFFSPSRCFRLGISRKPILYNKMYLPPLHIDKVEI